MNRGSGKSAGFAREFAAIANQDQCWDGADLVLLRRDRELFGVCFDDEKLAVRVRGDFGKFGRNHFARRTPGRPEVDEKREGGTLGDRLERRMGGDIDGLSGDLEFSVAAAATEGLAKAFVSEAIAFAALLARED